MSIDKWLNDSELKEKKEEVNHKYKELSPAKKKELKLKSIKNLTNNSKKVSLNTKSTFKDGSFLDYILKFKHWLNQRTYLKGDIPEIETWVKILYKKLQSEIKKSEFQNIERDDLIDKFNRIPPRFLDEKTRIALNKKIRNSKRTNSDNYYLRKLKKEIEEESEKARFYEILKEILDQK